MNKPLFSRALVAAAVIGVAGVAGVAQAETFNSPTQAGEASTMTHGAPNRLTTNTPGSSYYSYEMAGPLPAPVIDTTVLGGPPVVVYESSTIYPSSVYVQPSTNWGYSSWGGAGMEPGGATASSRVPDRAGEASTIVNGVPNRLP
jgi:hypothetical protein